MSHAETHRARLEAAHELRPRRTAAAGRIPAWWWLAALVLVVASWWLVLAQGRGVPPDLLARFTEFVGELFGVGLDGAPAYTQGAAWREVGALAVDTLVMSVLAAGLAGAGALATIAFAARNLTTGSLASVPRWLGRLLLVVTRGVHIVARAVPDFVWALLIVFVLRPSILAGALALALHNLGVMGRLGADVIEDLDPEPLHSLRSSGAGGLQVLAYGVLPQVLPQFITFLLYRWEVIIRASAVVGFVIGVGLGYRLRLALSFFDMTLVALILAVYVAIVWGVDLTSSALRRLAR